MCTCNCTTLSLHCIQFRYETESRSVHGASGQQLLEVRPATQRTCRASGCLVSDCLAALNVALLRSLQADFTTCCSNGSDASSTYGDGTNACGRAATAKYSPRCCAESALSSCGRQSCRFTRCSPNRTHAAARARSSTAQGSCRCASRHAISGSSTVAHWLQAARESA